MSCPNCPCPDICRAIPAYCAWAARVPPDPVEIRHICDASRMQGRPAGADPPRAGRPSAGEAIGLLAAIKRCPYRSAWPPCGCAGARCGLRRGAIVSHLDCLACVREYPQ